jgi:hypothetical protein
MKDVTKTPQCAKIRLLLGQHFCAAAPSHEYYFYDPGEYDRNPEFSKRNENNADAARGDMQARMTNCASKCGKSESELYQGDRISLAPITRLAFRGRVRQTRNSRIAIKCKAGYVGTTLKFR